MTLCGALKEHTTVPFRGDTSTTSLSVQEIVTPGDVPDASAISIQVKRNNMLAIANDLKIASSLEVLSKQVHVHHFNF